MGKDLDPGVTGRRLRIGFTRYNAERRYFEHLKNTALLVTVANAAEQKRLIAAIEGLIAEGAWKNDRSAGRTRVVDPASAVV